MADYIYPAPGVDGVEATLSLAIGGLAALDIPSLQDITVNASNDVFTWTQLDAASKKQIATTATNSLSMNLVLDQLSFFGDSTAAAGTAANKGIFGMSNEKSLVTFSLYLGDTSAATENQGKTLSGTGFITGLAPTVSADSPVWVSPITITVDGDYTVA